VTAFPSRALIFDFDGVIADSEILANAVLAEALCRLGLPTSLDQSLATYLGKRWPEVVAKAQTDLGRPLPENFAEDLKTAIHDRFRRDLTEVRGAGAFIAKFALLPRAIASSSSADRLKLCLEVLGLTDAFGGNVFSADLVTHGKPDPAIYLLAAARLKVAPAGCIVIEDSAGGVRAGLAAGMTVIGLTAASHLASGHDGTLKNAGAHHIATSWNEVDAIMTRLLATPVPVIPGQRR
jgi:beta-phosphoglucomutase-like phosphatase (HAD superfamily)